MESDEVTYDIERTVVGSVVAGVTADRCGQCGACDRALVSVAVGDREADDMGVKDVLDRAQEWLDEADKRGINMTDEHGYLAVIRDLSTEVRRLGALVPSNAIAWQERVVEVQKAMRAYRVLRASVEAMMAPLGYHGEISARDDRVQAVMDALAQINAEDRA
jgi:hypothetical protein